MKVFFSKLTVFFLFICCRNYNKSFSKKNLQLVEYTSNNESKNSLINKRNKSGYFSYTIPLTFNWESKNLKNEFYNIIYYLCISCRKYKRSLTKKIIDRDLYFQKVLNFVWKPKTDKYEVFEEEGSNNGYYIYFLLESPYLASLNLEFLTQEELGLFFKDEYKKYLDNYLIKKNGFLPKYVKETYYTSLCRNFNFFDKNKDKINEIIKFIQENKKKFTIIDYGKYYENYYGTNYYRGNFIKDGVGVKELIYKFPIYTSNEFTKCFIFLYDNFLLEKLLLNKEYRNKILNSDIKHKIDKFKLYKDGSLIKFDYEEIFLALLKNRVLKIKLPLELLTILSLFSDKSIRNFHNFKIRFLNEDNL